MPSAHVIQNETRSIIREALSPFGYDPACIRFDWQIPNATAVQEYQHQDDGRPGSLPQGQARVLDALAFGDSKRQDWNTSAIAFDLRQDDLFGTEESKAQAQELFELTAAPTIAIGSSARRTVNVWFSCHDGIVGSEGVEFSPRALQTVFKAHRSSVQRDMLMHLRAGQPHLFDGYLHARRDELTSFLQRGVSKATWIADELGWSEKKEQASALREAFSRVALGLLAARILEDKGALGEARTQSTDARQLLAVAKDRWDFFFDTVCDKDLASLDQWFQPNRVNLMLMCLLSHLTGPVTFGLVTHEMLGDLYERALVAERSFKSSKYIGLKGVHYTPLSITRQILDRIPLEDLPPSHRSVCDFACGSGSFLLAATDRLAEIYHPREPAAGPNRTAWLRQAVMGNDIDPIAILVANLSYLIAYWNRVDGKEAVPLPTFHGGGNALTLDLSQVFGRTPNVIVGNPPFDLTGHPASAFLDRALSILRQHQTAFPSYLGMVMPGAFLKGKKEQEGVRDKLLKDAKIFEVWELPEHAIGLFADTPTCVVFAEVNGSVAHTSRFVRVCQTNSRRTDAIDVFRDSAVPTWAYAATLTPHSTIERQRQPDALAFSSIDVVWSRLCERSTTVSSFADAVWGFVHTKMKGKSIPEFATHGSKNLVPYIRHQAAIQPYLVTEEDWLASHQDEYRFWEKGTGPVPCQANWANYESPKIVIPARSNRNAVSQLVAALDFAGYYPGKDFLAVTLRKGWDSLLKSTYSIRTTPDENDTLRWLCGILNSPIGHAWFAKHAGPRGPQADVCLTMPLPAVLDPDIVKTVRLLEGFPRPRNLGSVPTWNPEAGIIAPEANLYESEEAAVINRENEFWRSVSVLNNSVMESYGLKNAERKKFMAFLEGMVNPWVDHSPDVAQLASTTTLRVLRGKTLSVNTQAQTINIGFSWKSLGGGSCVSIPIPKFMPGWALQPEREFTCRAPARCTIENLKDKPWLLRDFRAIPYGYLDVETLEKMVGYDLGAPKT